MSNHCFKYYKRMKGMVVNQDFPSMQGRSLEIKLTGPSIFESPPPPINDNISLLVTS